MRVGFRPALAPVAATLGLAAIAVALLAVPARAALDPAVARARYGANQGLASGTVFFLETDLGSVAVGASHSFDYAKLATSPELLFELGRTRTRVGVASRMLTPPGTSFSAPDGSLATDFVVFALDAPPSGVRVLQAGKPERGARIQLLGIPGSVPRDEDDVFGRLREADEHQLEIELDVAYDLRGWGGAPVLDKQSGRVIGIVQAAQPHDETVRVLATPIRVVVDALRRPLDAGRGRSLTAAAAPAAARAAASPEPARAAASAASAAKKPAPAVVAQSQPAPILTRKEQVIRSDSIWIEIESPPENAITGDENGAFVAGRALAPRGDYRNIDVVFVIDTSASTVEPSGADVNGNGVAGDRTPGSVGSLFGLGKVDPADSILAAEVAAVRRIVSQLDPRSTRIGLVSFAGEPETDGFRIGPARGSALTEVPLTTDYDVLQRALDRILQRGPRGATHMAAGVDRATVELRGLRGAFSRADPESEKVVIFLTDGQPTLPDPYSEDVNVRAVLRAADRARRAGLRVFTFGIGEDALEGPFAIVRLAEITGGSFTPVRNPSILGDVIEGVDFANLDEIRVRNLTNGSAAAPFHASPDGSFAGLVALVPGKNEIEATARASDGQVASSRVIVQYAPDAPKAPVPRPLLARYNRLLEERLIQIKRARVEIEDGQAEEARQKLRLEIERERAAANARAEEQRKTLQLEVEDKGEDEPEIPAAP